VHAWSKGRVAGYRYFGDRWIDQDLINGKCPRMMHTQVPRLTPRSSVQDGGAAGQGSTEGQDSAYIIDSIDRSCETADVARSSTFRSGLSRTRRGATNPCIHRSGISRGAGRGHARRHTARGWGRPSACKRRAKKRQRWGEKTDDASSRGRTCVPRPCCAHKNMQQGAAGPGACFGYRQIHPTRPRLPNSTWMELSACPCIYHTQLQGGGGLFCVRSVPFRRPCRWLS
jgi:hypothetical protein